jgi:hypothetical protein
LIQDTEREDISKVMTSNLHHQQEALPKNTKDKKKRYKTKANLGSLIRKQDGKVI